MDGQLATAAGATTGGGNNESDTVQPPISWVPNEVLCIIFSLLDAKTLMIAVPQVCKFWRSMCQELSGVHLDFRRWKGMFLKRNVPLEVLAGWRVLPTLLTVEGADGGGDGADGGGIAVGGEEQQEGRWSSGMCALFPHTTSVTMADPQEVEDAHLLALADKCRGLTHVDFGYCYKLTDAAVLALADKCRGITHVDFNYCDNLTDAALLALADKCRGLTHIAFRCGKLTDAAVLGLADKCRGLTHANFGFCGKLTDAAVLELADKCQVPWAGARHLSCVQQPDGCSRAWVG